MTSHRTDFINRITAGAFTERPECYVIWDKLQHRGYTFTSADNIFVSLTGNKNDLERQRISCSDGQRVCSVKGTWDSGTVAVALANFRSLR